METELVRRAQEGDADAFLTLIERHDRQVMSVIYRFSGDRHDREDLYHEVFVHAFESIRRFRGASSFRTWLYRVALNRCLSYVKRRPPVREPEDAAVDPEDWVQRAKVRSILRAMDSLSDHQRMCFFLHYVEGWNVAEIEELLDVRSGTVKSHLNRARAKIRGAREVMAWQTT